MIFDYLLLIVTLVRLSKVFAYVGQMDQYSDLIRSHINVVVEPLTVIMDLRNNRTILDDFDCTMTIHRNRCFEQNGDLTPSIDENEPISWNTKICFRWHCGNSSDLVMRIENCWTGSIHNPIYLIDEHGCSLERTMIRTPRYEPSLNLAYSSGWLSVRLVGARHIQLSCSIRACHLCDQYCKSVTPPSKCADSDLAPNIWNETKKIRSYCTPTIFTKTNSTMRINTNLLTIMLYLLILSATRLTR